MPLPSSHAASVKKKKTFDDSRFPVKKQNQLGLQNLMLPRMNTKPERAARADYLLVELIRDTTNVAVLTNKPVLSVLSMCVL